MKKLFYLFLSIVLFSNFSCSSIDDNKPTTEYKCDLSAVKIDNDIVTIPSKEYLSQIVNEYKKGVTQQNNFNNKIKELQNNGFHPLSPCFDGLSKKQIEEFVIRKRDRINQRNVDYGLYNREDIRDYELDLDDDLVSDPVLSSLLNEQREIIIADIFYKYTELGLLYIQKDSKQTLLDYINNKTPIEKYNLIIQHKNEFSSTDYPEEKIESLGGGLESFRILSVLHTDPAYNGDGEGGYNSGGSNDGNIGGTNGTGQGSVIVPGTSTGTTTSNSGNGEFNPLSFEGCTIESQGFFEDIFGESESCYEYYNDNRRVKVKFWNQNLFIISSIGCKTKLQKREHLDLLIGSISWWEKSYATQLRLGVNNVTFKYNFNVPMYNQAQYNYETTFFEYNGTKYNINGQVIPTVPTSAGCFNFPVNNVGNVVDITFSGVNLQLDNGQINQAIDTALNQLLSAIQSSPIGQELLAKKSNQTLEIRAVYAKPFANSVIFILSKQNWSSNDDNEIVHYFDFNFMFTYNSSYSSAQDYLQGLNGATNYYLINADVYGAALHNNFWKGRRLFSN